MAYSRRLPNVARQQPEFAQISINHAIRLYRPGDAVFNRDILVLFHIGAEDAVPDRQQVAEIGVHVEHVARVMKTMMRGRQHNAIKYTKLPLPQHILAEVDEASPEAIDDHDEDQEWRAHAQQHA